MFADVKKDVKWLHKTYEESKRHWLFTTYIAFELHQDPRIDIKSLNSLKISESD